MKADKPKELPKLDIPEDWIIGTDISREILNMYTNFPCRLKAGIFVLCLQGEIEASIDATNYTVKANDFVTIVPGSILQIHKVEGDLHIYFLGYSSQFITETNIIKSTLDIFYTIKATPVISLKEEVTQLFHGHLALLARTYDILRKNQQGDYQTYAFYLSLWIGRIVQRPPDTKNKSGEKRKDCEQLHPTGHATLQPGTERCLLCWKTRYYTGSSEHDYPASHRKNLFRNYCIHGHNGCKGSVEVN